MHVDEARQEQAAAALDVGILDRLVTDFGNPAVFDPDSAIGNDTVTQDNFEVTQPHVMSLASGFRVGSGFKVDFADDKVGDIFG
ncbi:hypothetical protein X742_16870 [Mesorhizobium sp. LNHC232B00]|nr:hypothetical protein X742_16870 [Mesorhizobium sp. LNHC232B00]